MIKVNGKDINEHNKPEKNKIVHERNDISYADGNFDSGYQNWSEYEAAVKRGDEISPPIVKNRVDPNQKYKFNVDKALDSIDLTFSDYTPSKEAIEFFILIRLVMGEEPELKNSKMHYFLVDLVFNKIKVEDYPFPDEIRSKIRLNPKKIAIIAARRSAKSTILTTYLPIYVAIKGLIPNFGSVMFWVSFGDSQQSGARVQANSIRDICEESEFCKTYFEKMRFTDEECEFTRKGSGKSSKRSFMFKVKGAAGGSIRGIRYKGERPNILTFDDIIKTEADANSVIIMSKLRSMIYSDAESAMSNRSKIIIINTPFNKKDPVYNALENGVWTPMCIPMCKEISLDLKKEDFVGSWEAMNNYDWAIERYHDAHYGDTLREFNQELMLRIASEEQKLIKKDQLQWYSRSQIEKNIAGYKIVGTTDYTASNSTDGDFSATMLWAVNHIGAWFLLDMSLKKEGIEEQYEHIFRMVQKYSLLGCSAIEVGIEVDGQQQLNIHALKSAMRLKNIYFSFSKQIGKPYGSEGFSRVGSSKHGHFMRVHPIFQNKKIYFPEELIGSPDMDELLEELNSVTYTSLTAIHDDGIDCVSAIGLLDIILPSMIGYSDDPIQENRIDNPVWKDMIFSKNNSDERVNSVIF
ncbi:MAG: hypothetical protein L3I99_05825 [Sulfurimonas sp.]|nr:hypothetical protein [Sulfurimonas sp.]